MRRLTKILLGSTTFVFFHGCGPSGSSNVGDMPVYPPAPPPPFRSDLKPTLLFSNAEADFTCLTNETKPSDIKCWGDNSRAQVSGNGIPSTTAAVTVVAGIPKELHTDIPGYETVVLQPSHVAVGKSHACASLNDYSIWCWGDNTSAQLDSSLNPTDTHAATHIGAGILPDADVNALAAGNAHTCAAFSDDENSVWCWGDNSDGQVSGDGIATAVLNNDSSVSSLLTFTNVTQNSNLPKTADDVVIALSAGHNFTCAVYENRANVKFSPQTVWCWGNNTTGQVTGEINNAKNRSQFASAQAATKVVGLPTGKITSLATGYDHACVSLADGNIWCWGNDQNAQVSGIKNTKTLTPGLTLVQGIPKNALAMSAGENFSCAAFKDANLWCWGDNQNGAVDGAGMQGSYAQRITNISTVNQSVVLAAGAHHMCAAFPEGNVVCWGDNQKGQVSGNATVGQSFERVTPLAL